MKKKLVVLALSLTLVVVFSHAALAAGAGNKCVRPNRDSSQNQNQTPLAEKLKLSDRQVQQLKEINLSTYQSTKALKIKLMDAKFELRQLRIAGTDKSAMDEKVKPRSLNKFGRYQSEETGCSLSLLSISGTSDRMSLFRLGDQLRQGLQDVSFPASSRTVR
ncbi:MAG: pilus assembly/Cpx signaling pathway periplasmic inhibitor/zinc-resistance associated protein [Firmicutes bacterium]|nr:pilus assembly/Cpx signaling pathway periplasmic inhibitor/zinc-resistance associated protein [Bacillota bacterium]